MNKLLKITQTLIFTILIIVITVFVWQFFNDYAKLFFLPLGILSIYYLLVYSFAKLLLHKNSSIWLYIGIIFVIIPLIAFSLAYKEILEFSYHIMQSFGN